MVINKTSLKVSWNVYNEHGERGAPTGAGEHSGLKRSAEFRSATGHLGMDGRRRSECAHDPLAPQTSNSPSQFFMVRKVPRPSKRASLVTNVKSMT